MPFFYGPQRKLSLLLILLFFCGWSGFFVGYMWKTVKPSRSIPRWDDYPAIVAIAVGPVFILASLLQSCLYGIASAAMGSIAGICMVFFLVALGNSSITNGQALYQYNSTAEEVSLTYPVCAVAGSAVCCLAIAFLLSLWGYYWQSTPRTTERRQRRGRRGQIMLRAEDEDETDTVRLLDESGATTSLCKNSLFAGYSRKLAIPCIIFAFLGWGVLVGGHHQRITRIPQEGTYNDGFFSFDFGQWGVVTLTPLLLLFSLLHAGSCGRVSSIMGVVVSIMNTFVLVSIGYYMIHDVGEWLYGVCHEKDCNFTVPQDAAALSEIIGSFVFCFFWACAVATWPFYQNDENVARNTQHHPELVAATGYNNRRSQSTSRKIDDDDIGPISL